MTLTTTTIKIMIREELERLSEIPMAYDPTTNQDTPVEMVLDMSNNQKTRFYKAKAHFNALYRSLDSTTRYQLEKWLVRHLKPNLSIDELLYLVSRATAATKGQSSAKRPNKKPD